MVMSSSIYQTKPLGVFVTSIFAGAFAFNVGFDVAVTSFWDRWNQGVSGRHIQGRSMTDSAGFTRII
jgi:ubiquinol-cytochrome c reductase subunit 9